MLQKSRKSKFYSTLALLISLLLILLVIIWYKIGSTDYLKLAQKNEMKQEQILIDNIKIIDTQLNSNDYHYHLQYLKTGQQQIDDQVAQFLNEAKTSYFKNVKDKASLTSEITVSSIGHQRYQLLYTINNHATNNVDYYSVIYDTAKQQAVNFVDLFNKDTQVNQYLTTTLSTAGISTETFDKALKHNPNLFHNFSITHDDQQDIINFYFATNTLDKSAQSLSVDLSSMKSTIHSSYWKSLLKNDTSIKYIALTFDDGPHTKVTPQILDTLKQYQVPATFYIIGKNVAGREAIIQRETNEGHEQGNHSWDHPHLTQIDKASALAEINDTTQAINQAGGHVKSIRPPYGDINENLAQQFDYPCVLWNVDTLDWKSRNADAIYNEVVANVRAGSIILMHDIHQTSADALPRVIEYLQKEGYQFVTVSELLESEQLENKKGIFRQQ